MADFRFKQFIVSNERSAMKVNTDGVLLGALMSIETSDRHVLDVGTGTGTIALMAAQRLNELSEDFAVQAIDIDEPSAQESQMNFERSPWSSSLRAHHLSLEEYSATLDSSVRFDLICSNPPYFENSLQAPEQRRNAARHTSSLSYRELLSFASERLSDSGRIALVLPADTRDELCRYARMHSLFPSRITSIRTVPRKAPSRIVAEFSRQRKDIQEDILTIQDEGKYTSQYLALVGNFLLLRL